jgi:hypothetical protein
MSVQRRIFVCIAMVALLNLVGCSGATVTKTWKDPSLVGPIKFKKTVTLCIHPDRIVRKVVEDEMVKQIGPDKAVAGYTILSDDDRKEVARVKAKVQSGGFDGAVVLKLAGARSEVGSAPASGGEAPFYDYYDRAAGFMGSSEESVSDTIIAVQANIYSVNDGKLVWDATIELRNPTDARQIVADVAKAVGDELRKEKLLQ